MSQMIAGILNKLQAPAAPATEKTASVNAADAAIEAALATLTTEKTASSQGAPVNDLMKMASEMAATDEDANLKLAHRMGAAFVDGQVERMRQYEKAAEELQTPDAEKQAAFEAGYNETVELIHKTAAAHFVIGHDTIVSAIRGA